MILGKIINIQVPEFGNFCRYFFYIECEFTANEDKVFIRMDQRNLIFIDIMNIKLSLPDYSYYNYEYAVYKPSSDKYNIIKIDSNIYLSKLSEDGNFLYLID